MIAIVKYNAGNIGSVTNALNRLGVDNIVTDDPKELQAADKVIFPGVGEASTAMKYLKERGLDKVIKELTQPVLGICLGMQLMCTYSEEGSTDCLGIFDTIVKKFPDNPTLKVPHMGWNNIASESSYGSSSPLLKSIDSQDDVYYVHSYYAVPNEDSLAVCNYINPFASMMNKGNFYATQFHPEKSAQVGEQLLTNFLNL
ncbi:imidazole glycerol phosphate synthase subunit HisH [Nonlabens tegetincola]|uniref:imidazole glycerol phosphate synthase subunit HisH n=1 Tax=Nonlabens tegetincola TaxID=323273 RepID=UPI000CF470A9|nr:imidazole glycerol phosphate synthase subunit HisH [Nonlabens tegetincola]PQJ19272.1 imidazole glycerol phosphate synthase subunit HisH [Nonlabens tegetincola]